MEGLKTYFARQNPWARELSTHRRGTPCGCPNTERVPRRAATRAARTPRTCCCWADGGFRSPHCQARFASIKADSPRSGADDFGEPYRQFFQMAITNLYLGLSGFRPGIAPGGQQIIPIMAIGLSAPLAFEFKGASVLGRTAKIKILVALLYGKTEYLPVHPHIGVPAVGLAHSGRPGISSILPWPIKTPLIPACRTSAPGRYGSANSAPPAGGQTSFWHRPGCLSPACFAQIQSKNRPVIHFCPG